MVGVVQVVNRIQHMDIEEHVEKAQVGLDELGLEADVAVAPSEAVQEWAEE